MSIHSGPTPRGRLESEERVSTAHAGRAADAVSSAIDDLIIMMEV
jgi:hypothetical protein